MTNCTCIDTVLDEVSRVRHLLQPGLLLRNIFKATSSKIWIQQGKKPSFLQVSTALKDYCRPSMFVVIPFISFPLQECIRGHSGLIRVRSIWCLLFEIKRVLVYNSTIFKLTDLFILYFFIQNVYADEKVFLKKTTKLY